MPIAKKICRVCGKSYEACRSAKRDIGVFHWQEVACSPECGTKYLRMVNEARNPVARSTKTTRHAKRKEPEVAVLMGPIIVESAQTDGSDNIPTIVTDHDIKTE